MERKFTCDLLVLSSLLMKKFLVLSLPHPPLFVCLSLFPTVCLHSVPLLPSSNLVIYLSPLSFLGPECALPPHSAPPYHHHNHHYHYPQNPPASPALLVHTECPRDCPLDDTMHQSVLHMPHHLGTAA